jgi:predicted metal-dependent hydrolase
VTKMNVKIIRSRRRRKTVSGRVVKDTLLVHAPLMLSQARLEEIITDLKSRIEKKKVREELNQRENLANIASRMNEKYFGNRLRINSIEYVTDQNTRFGCCNYQAANIRISHRIAAMPAWVRDYVIIHEMAHLIEPNHSRTFWDIVCRYKLTERARGYLMAAGLGIEGDRTEEDDEENNLS